MSFMCIFLRIYELVYKDYGLFIFINEDMFSFFMRILIGCPTFEGHDYTLEEFLEGIKNIDYDNYGLLMVDNSDTDVYYKKLKSKGLDVVRFDLKGKSGIEKVAFCRKYLRQKFLEGSYDYLLFVDQDIIVPKNVIKKLLSCGKDVVTGLCFTRKEKDGEVRTIPVAFVDYGDGRVTHLSMEEAFKDQIVELKAMGFGCALISRKVLEKVDIDYDSSLKNGEDIQFSVRLNELGIKMFVDTSVKCKHNIMKQKDKWKE